MVGPRQRETSLTWGIVFGRKKGQGLYTGDAPVSIPGAGGAEPVEYLPSTGSDSASPWGNASDDPGTSTDWGTNPTDPGTSTGWGASPTPTPSSPTTPSAPGPTPADWTWPSVPSDRGATTGPPVLITGGRSRPSTGRPFRGVWVTALVLFVLLFVGVGVLAAVGQHSSSSSSGADGADGSGSPNDGDDSAPLPLAVGTVGGAPVLAQYEDAKLRWQVHTAVRQPGQQWFFADKDSHPQLVVDVGVQLDGGDTGDDDIWFDAQDWTFTPANGKPLTGDTNSGYSPTLNDQDLDKNGTARGYLSFDLGSGAARAVTTGQLSLTDPYTHDVTATWIVAAKPVAAVTGTIGTPAQGAVGTPPFTMTLAQPRSLSADDPAVVIPPTSGHYLVASFTLTPAADMPEFGGGILSTSNFFFVPAGSGRALESTLTATDSTLVVETIGKQAPIHSQIAFDTAATTGTIALRDATGNDVITWAVSGG